MKNKFLVVTLGLCTAVCTVIADYAYTGQVYDERAAEYERYQSLNADPHMLYSGYTVEELGEGMKSRPRFSERSCWTFP